MIYKRTKEYAFVERKLEKRLLRNFAERKRRHRLTASFHVLEKKIPLYLKPVGKRMKQLQILTCAIQYIKDLYSCLELDNKKKWTTTMNTKQQNC